MTPVDSAVLKSSPLRGAGPSAGWWRGLASKRDIARAQSPLRQPFGLPPPPTGEEVKHAELFAASRDAAGAALALAFALDQVAPDQRPWLWVQDQAALRLSGRPYRPGLPASLRHTCSTSLRPAPKMPCLRWRKDCAAAIWRL